MGPPADYEIDLPQSFQSASDVPIGTAVDSYKLKNNQTYRDLVIYHFDSIVGEWQMKWNILQPERGQFNWEQADYLMDFAEENNISVHGHCLVWHGANPDWIESFSGGKEEFQTILKTHIQTVVNHFEGKVDSWDVVNEAFEGKKYRRNKFYRILGPDYIKNCYKWAHEADPNIDLYYNDYSLASNPEKLDFILEKLDSLLNEEIPIHGIGFQSHITLNSPTLTEIKEAMTKVENLGLKIRISELDVSLNRDGKYGVFTDELAELQKNRYKQVVEAYLNSSQVKGITVWGVSDAHSWIPTHFNDPDWPLLFDGKYKPKPAAQGFLEALVGFSNE